MENEFIKLKEYCDYYKVEASFIEELESLDLIEILREKDEEFISFELLPDLESFVRMFYDLNINTEGISAIHHMLERMKEMQKEVNELRNRLRFYE